jgi:cell division protein FtsW (lipid II flippase)
MYVAMRMRSIWRLVLATVTTSFLVAVVVLGSSSHGAGSWQAPACGAPLAPSVQVMAR